ncbi:DUF4136 domain-containing protein [Simiduia agarivorans]|uniref:DUF4136 domain-containing protein n=1 Tax=Simiduia agarivorans (strain DSM 21679 / JCM 13881 / BCRC 17597 / SA1) TaxID=1117647 RepID=K4KZN5_SIMAS|nr:DUF4136 domain-containing protein [Simiduia agarivorans]AFU99397.1 hypothetical protein M5M_11100 [Simiduia agarivorans SA1 = DSM 21679]
MNKLATLLVAAAMFAVAGCSSLPKADSDWNQDFDFSKVHTYNFIDRSKLRDMTPLTDDITRNRIENAVDKSMKLKQFTLEADKAKADLLVSYHVTTKDKQDIRTYNVGVNSCWNCWGRGPGMGMGYGTDVRVNEYTEGTLIIDMIDTKSNESVWRGTLSAKISNLKTQQERIDAINYAVTTILAQFPPGTQPEK